MIAWVIFQFRRFKELSVLSIALMAKDASWHYAAGPLTILPKEAVLNGKYFLNPKTAMHYFAKLKTSMCFPVA